MQYTKEQKRAINHEEGNLLILACAGSGKTEVISRRIARLVSRGTEKGSIIAFTFTEKAASELKARIRLHMEDLCGDNPELGDMYVGTIHSFALQLLKEFKPEYRNYQVIDDAQQASFLVTKFYDIGLQKLQNSNGIGYFKTIGLFINTLNAYYLKKPEIPEDFSDVHECIQNYYTLLKEPPRFFLDFNMIIAELIQNLHEDNRFRQSVYDKIKHVIVDEYQDIDPRQEELIRLLTSSGANLCVVGDDDQAIYGWRGADVTNILEFENRYDNVTKIPLINNFRSTHAIVEVANRSVRKLSRRLDKAMKARFWEECEGEKVLSETMAEKGDCHKLIFSSEEEEAEYITDRILELRGTEFNCKGQKRGLDWGDFAVLFRSVKNNAAPLVEVFKKKDIKFIVKGAQGLFDHPEIKFVQAAFHILADCELWEDFGKSQLDERALRERIESLGHELAKSRLPGLDKDRFFEWLAGIKEQLNKANLPEEERPINISRRIYFQDIFHDMLESMGSTENEWEETALYNLGRFSNLLTKYEAIHQWFQPRDLGTFCKYIDNWAIGNVEEGGPEEFLGLNAVQISTIHKAKGLEWPVVFIPRISSYHFPSQKRDQGIKTFLSDIIDEKSFAEGDDGERRLWYVAVTRSKKYLDVSSVDYPRHKPQEFIKEIKHDYFLDITDDPTNRKIIGPSAPINALLLPTNFSDLNYYWRCPRDYQLRRIMGFGPKIGQEFGYGEQIHNILAILHGYIREAREVPSQPEIEKLFNTHFNLRYTRGEPFERMKLAAKATIDNYINAFKEILPFTVLEAEKPFEFVLEEALVSGTIDLLEKVDEVTGDLIPVGLVDFKTGIPDDETEFALRLEESSKQLLLYAIASKEALKLDPKSAAVHFLSKDKQRKETVEISDELKESIYKAVDKSVKDIKAGKFPKKKSKKRCSECDLRKICSWKI